MDTKKLLKVGAFTIAASIATLTVITASISFFNPLILPAALILSPIKWSIIGIISTVVLVCSGVGLYHISREMTKNAKNEAQKNENT
ncbi:hypothetical protein [Wolbachia pipientis]|uniref:hypothetical protein n=1 Tax=Wolbachia pipientis TaxID=955 RepID=UPI0020B753A9|nr:hypothetical protein [Wolbachia pipientis]